MPSRPDLALLQGDIAETVRWADMTLPSAGRCPPWGFLCAPPLTLPKVLLAQDTPASRQKAAEILSGPDGLCHIRTITDTIFSSKYWLCRLCSGTARARSEAALAAMERATGLAQPGGFIRLFVDLGPRMAGLLVRLGGQSAHPEYVAEIQDASQESMPVDLREPDNGNRAPDASRTGDPDAHGTAAEQ